MGLEDGKAAVDGRVATSGKGLCSLLSFSFFREFDRSFDNAMTELSISLTINWALNDIVAVGVGFVVGG